MRSDNLSTTTWVTGYWDVPNNAKHDPGHYRRLLPKTLQMVRGGKLVAFVGERTFERLLRAVAAEQEIELHVRRMELTELPAYGLAADVVDACSRLDITAFRAAYPAFHEKGTRHFERDYLESGPQAFRKLLSTWLSKTSLVADVVLPANPFGTEHFAWMDISVGRFCDKRENWDFAGLDLSAPVLHHYGNRMRYRDAYLPLNASLLSAPGEVWPQIQRRFWSQLERQANDGYPHDEETIFGEVYAQAPELFRCLGQPYAKLEELWQGAKAN